MNVVVTRLADVAVDVVVNVPNVSRGGGIEDCFGEVPPVSLEC